MMIPEGYMEDAQGKLVPETRVKPEHKLEDELVRRLCNSAAAINDILRAFKTVALDDLTAFRGVLAQEYGVERGGQRGNLTFRSYNGQFEIQVAVSDTLVFGPELDAAKSLIDECVEEWSDGADDNLKTLVFDAFQMNKQGRIDTTRVLGLRRLDIDHPKWRRAMEAISNAVRVHSSKTYVRFYRIDNEAGTRDAITLDLAGV